MGCFLRLMFRVLVVCWETSPVSSWSLISWDIKWTFSLWVSRLFLGHFGSIYQWTFLRGSSPRFSRLFLDLFLRPLYLILSRNSIGFLFRFSLKFSLGFPEATIESISKKHCFIALLWRFLHFLKRVLRKRLLGGIVCVGL